MANQEFTVILPFPWYYSLFFRLVWVAVGKLVEINFRSDS